MAADEAGHGKQATGTGAQSHAKGANWEDMVNVSGDAATDPEAEAREARRREMFGDIDEDVRERSESALPAQLRTKPAVDRRSLPPSVLAAEEAAEVRREGSPSRMQRMEARRQQMVADE